uniref:Sulfotransferase domain-containing protein n=1 Tax=Octactis speculum TaxID=3111310 RepID=A0A6U3XFT8_9STRA|mmetsp:Transcript_55110/g.75325  ORF Transcript_55110/g.75325 Transcript_55110/m.75325 type:complete len:281 (+) Transcript_55110:284-1126(+)
MDSHGRNCCVSAGPFTVTCPTAARSFSTACTRWFTSTTSKAGSTSLRKNIGKNLNVKWNKPSGKFAGLVFNGRTTSENIGQQDADEMFIFSIARDPVDKFLSGVREARKICTQSATFKKEICSGTADDVLARQLAKEPGKFLNEHLQPTTYRLSGQIKSDQKKKKSHHSSRISIFENIDYIGELTTVGFDLRQIANRLSNIADSDRVAFASDLSQARSSESRGYDLTLTSSLSPDSIRAMCNSVHYGDEWRCLGYSYPAVCEPNRNMSIRSNSRSVDPVR